MGTGGAAQHPRVLYLSVNLCVGFALRSGSVNRTLPEGECEAGTPNTMFICLVPNNMFV